jgi:uncharacterized protein YxjI
MKYVYLKQKVFAIRDEFKVYDENQSVRYEARGKFISFNSQRDIFQAGQATPIYTMKQKIFAFAPTYFLYDQNKVQVAKMAQQLFTFFGTRFNLIIGEKKYELTGDFFGYQYAIRDDQGLVVQISKKFLSWGDTYQIAIADSFSEPLAVGVVLMIDDFIDDIRRRRAAAASSAAASSHRPPRGGNRR